MGMFKRSHKVVLAGLAALAIAGVMTGCGMSGGDQKQAAASGNGQKVELKLAYQLLQNIICPRALKNLRKK